MGWTNPRSWTTGELVGKAIMDAHIRDNLNYLYDRPRVSVRRTSAQTGIADATTTSIEWHSSVVDTHGMWSWGSPTVVTCQVAGFYAFDARVNWDDALQAGTGLRSLTYVKNGTTEIAGDRRLGSAPTEVSVPCFTNLAVGDTIAVQLRHTSGVAQSVQYNASRSPILVGVWIAPSI